jgi:hypothetical protein
MALAMAMPPAWLMLNRQSVTPRLAQSETLK